MNWEKVKNYFKEKQGATVVAAALASQVAYAQNNPKVEDKKQDKTEKVVVQEVVEDGNVYTAINGNPVHGNTYNDVKQDYKNYVQEQKDAYENGGEIKTDTIPFQEFVQHQRLGQFNPETKDISRSFIDVENSEHVSMFVQNQYAGLSKEEQAQKVEKVFDVVQQYNNPASLSSQSVLGHEVQHQVSDKNNVYAPGLSVTQYGQLNQIDEITANFSSLLLIDKKCQDEINQGKSPHEVFKVFDMAEFKDFSFYKDMYAQKESLGTDKFQAALWQKTSQMWQSKYQQAYGNQIKSCMESKCFSNDVGSLAFGDDKEFQKRVNKLLNGVKDNQILKQAGVKVGDFSKHISNKVVALSPEMQKEADAMTLHYTGMTPDYAQKLSKEMPGSQKKDAVNLLRYLSGRPLPKKIVAQFDRQRGIKDMSQNIQNAKNMQSQLTAAQQSLMRSQQVSR